MGPAGDGRGAGRAEPPGFDALAGVVRSQVDRRVRAGTLAPEAIAAEAAELVDRLLAHHATR